MNARLLPTLIGLCFINVTVSQNWTVGNPVHQVIIDLPFEIEVTAYCDSLSGQEAEFHIPLPIVSGVDYYVHIDKATPLTDSFKLIHNGKTEILRLRDSMLIVPVTTTPCIQYGEPCEVIKLSYAGPVPQLNASFCSIKFMAVGTPAVAGERYPYSYCDAWISQGVGCFFPHYVLEVDILTGDTCFTTSNTVQSSTFTYREGRSDLTVYPNPNNGVVCLNAEAGLLGERYTLFDKMGRPVLSGNIASTQTVIEIIDLPRGIYFLSVGDAKGLNVKIIRE